MAREAFCAVKVQVQALAALKASLSGLLMACRFTWSEVNSRLSGEEFCPDISVCDAPAR